MVDQRDRCAAIRVRADARPGYAFVVSGKPLFSLPANIPVIFETTVLLAALGAVIGMLAMNNLPRHHRPLLAHPRFKRATTDRFYVVIDAADPRFDATTTRAFLGTLGGTAVEAVETLVSSAKLPRAFVIGGLIVACLALLPPLFIARARVVQTDRPRIQIIQDMDNQERFKTQQAAAIFADGRAMRPQVVGTLARGDLRRDTHFYAGTRDGDFATTFPPQIEIDTAFVRRGQQRFNIYCAPCHGLGGAGDGIVAQRAINLGTPGWVPPTNLATDPTVIERPVGHLFNSITTAFARCRRTATRFRVRPLGDHRLCARPGAQPERAAGGRAARVAAGIAVSRSMSKAAKRE
jgi:hypothetical protein